MMRSFIAAATAVLALSAAAFAQGTPSQSWKITKDHWDASDESGFGRFVAGFGESTCSDPISCFESAANPYRHSDPPNLIINGDCADFIYQLRAYYAWKNGLPFSYALYVMPKVDPVLADRRFTDSGNVVIARLQVAWQDDTDPVRFLNTVGSTVSTAMFRVSPEYDKGWNASDFYSPKIAPGAIRPGTAIYDRNGHVVYVYKIMPDGEILTVDSNPDRSVTRSTFGRHMPRTGRALGGLFQNFRPIRLEGYTRMPDGSLRGGRFTLARNNEITDFSLEQFTGSEGDAGENWRDAVFKAGDETVDFYTFVKRRLASTRTASSSDAGG